MRPACFILGWSTTEGFREWTRWGSASCCCSDQRREATVGRRPWTRATCHGTRNTLDMSVDPQWLQSLSPFIHLPALRYHSSTPPVKPQQSEARRRRREPTEQRGQPPDSFGLHPGFPASSPDLRASASCLGSASAWLYLPMHGAEFGPRRGTSKIPIPFGTGRHRPPSSKPGRRLSKSRIWRSLEFGVSLRSARPVDSVHRTRGMQRSHAFAKVISSDANTAHAEVCERVPYLRLPSAHTSTASST